MFIFLYIKLEQQNRTKLGKAKLEEQGKIHLYIQIYVQISTKVIIKTIEYAHNLKVSGLFFI